MTFIQSKKTILISLCLIVVVGIFLRTYHFSDWLKFNSDQARDASIVREMVNEKKIPLLGPIAGGSQFKIGPISYYFQFASAKLFGVSPDKMAYPDLLWGILAIPLIYFFLREFFQKPSSLILAGLYAVSYFTVEYSRFAWNSNSAQFFCLLLVFSFIKILNTQKRNKTIWLILAGLSLGIAIQLHTLVLFGAPLFFLAIAIYLGRKKILKLTEIIAILLIAVSLNIPQIINEVRSKGGNYAHFKQALIYKSEKQSPLWKNALHVASCQVYSNAGILIPRKNQDDCEDPFADKYFKRLNKKMEADSDWALFIGKFLIVSLFSLGGYFLLFYSLRKNKNEKRKNFAIVIVLFNLSIIAVSIPFGAEISLRYFISLTFIPYVILGLLTNSLKKSSFFLKNLIAFFIMGSLIVYNLLFNLETFRLKSKDIPGNMIDGTMNQAREIADYIMKEAGSHKRIQLVGQRVYLGRFINRILYFMLPEKFEIIYLDKKTKIKNDLPLFAIVTEMSSECRLGMFYKYGEVEKCQQIYDVTIIKIKNNFQ